MASSKAGRSVVFWVFVVLLSPVLLPIMLLQAMGFLKQKPFRWETFPADRDVPLRRWARCVQSIVANDTGNREDSIDHCRKGLAQGWGVTTRSQYDRIADCLLRSNDEDMAWDLGRFIGVARMALVAGLIDDDHGWEQIRQAADRLRGTYSSWRELAAGMEQGLQRQAQSQPEPWQASAARLIKSNVGMLEATLWADTPWDLAFE